MIPQNLTFKHFENTEVGLTSGTQMRRVSKHAKQEHTNDHEFEELTRQIHVINKLRLYHTFYERAFRIAQQISANYHIWGEGVLEQDLARLSQIFCH